MTRKEELLQKLRAAPTDKSAMDNLVAFYTQRGDFQALYEGLQEVVEGIDDRGLLSEFRSKLVEIVRKHLDHASDQAMAASLKLRLAGLLFDRATQPKEALILVTEAFERLPSEEVAQRAVHMLKEMKLSRFVVMLLKRKATAEEGSERQADTLFQLGHAALSAGNVHQARDAFEKLHDRFKGWSRKAEEGLQQTESALRELEKSVADLEARIGNSNDVERPVLETQMGRKLLDLGRAQEGVDLLTQVMDRSPSDDVCMELVGAYKEQESWTELVALVDHWAESVKEEDSRRELLKERARVYTLKLNDRKAGYAALEDLYKRFPGNADVVEFCVNIYSECDDHDALARLLGKARQDTRDRDQERRYLEWEAALKWRKLGDLEAAEKLYRRIKSIDPRNEPALLFYEEYSREKGDFRKLYSVLSTRQSLAPDSQKVRILKSMAALAEEHLESPDRAIDSLKKVLVLDPKDDEAFDHLSRLLEATRRWHAVIEHYTSRVDRLADDQVERKLDLLQRVKEIYASKDKLPVPEMVVTTYRRILQIDDRNREAIEALADYYRKNNRWGELTEVLEGKVELAEDEASRIALHKEIAQLLVDFQHQEGAAIPHLEKVVAIDAKDDDALRLLARAYRGRGEFEKFFAVGTRLLDLVSGREQVELLEELATIATERLQLEDEACALLEQLFEADPRHPWALRRLRQLYDKLERYEELADVITRGIDQAPAAKQRSLKEKLGVVLSDKLHRYDEAKAIFLELLEENAANRQVRQYLQRLLAQAGEFDELAEMYAADKNLPGLMRFLDEFRLKEAEVERARAAGLEMVRIAEEMLKDKGRARQTLEALLEQFPTDADIARRLLKAYPASKADLDVARALAVLADHAEGQEAVDAAVRLGDVLQKNGEHDAAYTRTLGLFLGAARDGNFDLLPTVADRAEAADSLDNLTQVLEDLLSEGLPADAREELTLNLAGIHRARRKDPAQARAVLERELDQSPDSLGILRELERIHMETGDWAELEKTVRAMADAVLDLADKKEELHKLARLYEEIVCDAEKAGAVYQELRELDPADEEAYAGLKRSLEEREAWEELALVLEDELQLAGEEQARENLLQLAGIQRERLEDPVAAAETLRRMVERWPDLDEAWEALAEAFEKDEALSVVLPLLEQRHRDAEDWEKLVDVLAKAAQVAEDDHERFTLLGQCAAILEEKVERPAEAFSYLSVMVSMNPSEEGLLGRVESVARAADRGDDLYAICKGLLAIGESDFVPQAPLDEGREQEVAMLLADLAEERGENDVAIEALKRARISAPGDLDLFVRLETLFEAEERYDELLELLEEKREYVWEEQEKIGLYARLADVLSRHLDREEEAIAFVEELYSLAEQSPQVGERLEELYLKYERWPELANLLRARMASQEGEERRNVAYQLAIVCRDHLADLQSAYDLLSDIVAQEAENDLYVEALASLLSMAGAEGYDAVVLKVASVLEPIAVEREDWQRLVEVQEVKARQVVEPLDAAAAWLELGRTWAERLDNAEKALEAFSQAVQAYPGSEEALAALVETGTALGRVEEVVAALDAGIGDVGTTDEVAALAALAALLTEVGSDPVRAAGAYERLLELSPETLSHYRSLDALYAQSDDAGGRIRVLGELVDRLEGPEQAETLLELAQLQFAQGSGDEAVEALYRALTNPDFLSEERRPLAFHLLEEALEGEERWFDLCEVLSRRIDFTTDLDEKRALRYRVAEVEEEHLDNPDNAIKHYFAIIDHDPVDGVATGALFRLLEATSRFAELEELLATLTELTDEPAARKELLLRLARVRLVELGKPDLGVDALARLVEEEAFDPEILEMLEQVVENAPEAGFRATQLLETAYRGTAQYVKLAETYKTQIDRYADEVDRVERYRDLASLYEEHFSDVDTAFVYISQAFKLEPTSQAIHDQLISYAKERAGFDELFDIYLDVLVQLDEAEGRNNLRKKMVEIYHDELQDTEHAELIYRDMLDDEPGNEFALDRLQALYRTQENWEQLVDVLRARVEAARSDKVRIATLYEIASLHRESTGDLAEALDTYEQILSMDAVQWDAYRGIESLYFERGDVQGVTATLRRELGAREKSDERKEVRLRLAAILFTEMEEFDQSVEELAQVLEEFPEEDGALELLSEVIDAWESPSAKAVDLLVDARTRKESWDDLIALYQKLAARTVGEDERLEWFRKIYTVRVEKQENEVGAYAASKIMCTLRPADAEVRERLLHHALNVGDFEDFVGFLEGVLEHEDVAGTELEVEFQIVLARVYDQHLENGAAAVSFYELVAEGPLPETVEEARTALRRLYQELEAWDKYVTLLDTLAGESADVNLRKAFLLEAGQVARVTMGDLERAQEILSQAAEEFSDDEAVLDRYEQLLLEMQKADDLEVLLRDRVDRAPEPARRAEFRLRLGNLLLNQEERGSEGVEELLFALEEAPEMAVLWTILESLLQSEEVATDDRLQIARSLEDRYPVDASLERVQRTLEVHISLEEETAEINQLNLRLGELLEDQDPERAFVHFAQSLRLFPGVADVEEKVRELAERANLWSDYKDLLVQAAELAEEETLKSGYLLAGARVAEEKCDELDEAALLRERVLAVDEYNREALQALSGYYEVMERHLEWARVLEQEIALEEDAARRVERSMVVARLYGEQLDDIDRARHWWEELVHEADARAEACERLEEIYRQQEEWELLCDLLLEEREQTTDEEALRTILLKLAGLYEQYLDRLEEAFHWYRELLSLAPDFPAALHGARRCAEQLEDWQTMADVDARLLDAAEGEEAAAYRHELASLLIERLGRKSEGYGHLEALLDEPPVADEIKELAFSQIDDPDIGLAVCRRLEPLFEEDGAWDRIVQLFEVQLDALTDLEEKLPVVSRAVDVLREHLDDAERAFELLSNMLQQAPTAESLLDKLVELAEGAGDWQRYVRILEGAHGYAASVEQLVALALRIAEAHAERLENLDGALEWYRRVLEDSPGHEEAVLRIEALLEEGGRYDELVHFYEEIALDFSDEQRTAYLLKQGFLKEGQLDDLTGAMEAYREVLALDPDNEAAIGRLDGLLENPILSLAAVEILEPIYRRQEDAHKLSRLLRIKAQEVEGGLDRSQLLAEAANLLAGVEGGAADAFETYLQAIKQKQFDTRDTLSAAMELAAELARWQDLVNVLEVVCQEELAPDLKQEALRRLAVIYLEKLSNAGLAELKLRELLQLDSDNDFALTLLARVLEQQGEREELIGVLEKLGDQAVDGGEKRNHYDKAASLAMDLALHERAAHLFGQALRMAPDDAELMDRLIDLHRLTENWPELVELLESRASLLEGEEAVAALLEAAHIASTHMDASSRALALCRLILDRDEHNRDALRITVEILKQQGKVQEQLVALEKLAEAVDDDERTGIFFELKELALQSGDTEGALGYVQRLLEADPGNAEAMEAKVQLLRSSENVYNLVSTLEEQAEAEADLARKTALLYEVATTLADEIGDPTSALEKLADIRGLNPGHLQAAQKIAQIYMQQQEFDEAIKAYEDLAGLQEDEERRADALMSAARVALEELSDPTRARGLAEQVLASRPADGAAFALLADALERQESWEELAQLLLERVKQTTEPTERATLSKRLALVYRDGLGKEDLFLNWTEEAHRAVEDPDLVDELLAHYRNQGQLERVAPLLEWKVNYLTSRKQLREVPALLHDLGTLQAGLGVPDRALVALRRCVELDGSFLPGIHALAMLLFDQDQKEESLSHLQTLLLRINEFDDAAQKTDVYLRLAGIYLDKGDKKRAKTYLTRLLSIDKQNEQAKEMLATL